MKFTRLPKFLTSGLAAIILAAGASFALPSDAEARDFAVTDIVLNLANGEFDATLQTPDGPYKFQSAREVKDGIFIKLDLAIALNNAATSERLRKMVDQGFTDEPAGCVAPNFGPLDMEDGLRYFFETGGSSERVTATIYPGNRSTHWTNDVFCEFNESLGAETAVFRLTGFFFVIHRNLKDGVDIQLRPVTLSADEVNTYLTAQ
ncbi:MAG: hypothetical protein AAFU68_11865 [Pseudomonadota bacterium]